MRSKSPLTACRAAFSRRLTEFNPDIELDKAGYAAHATLNLLPGVQLADFEADLRQGDGNEIETKFRAAHSSSALAVNNFAPFKAHLTDLRLPGSAHFHSLQFERKCPHGLAGRRSPNLDVLAEGDKALVAIESKCHEYLSPHTAEFAPAYDLQIKDSRRETGWFAEMTRLQDRTKHYRWLDAAQLIKHALGLSYTFPEKQSTLLYLFWEPENTGAYSVFAEHRAEISEFAKRITGGGPRFQAMSYPDLWRYWEESIKTRWFTDHLANVRKRYSTSV